MQKEATKIKLRTSCNRCGKSLNEKQSSLTNWIFRRESCQCSTISSVDESNESVLVTVPSATELGLPEKYTIEGLLGKGGMGSVYRVKDTESKAVFALKILDRGINSKESKDLSESFQQELNIAKELTHANIVSIYEFGETRNGIPYLLMDCVQGEGLDHLLEEQVFLEYEHVLDIFIQVCDAMAHAHARGVIHRDLKPSNILLTRGSEGPEIAKVSDFGIARIVPAGTQSLVESTEVVGSPFYMSPEQCRGDAIDHRTDIYSLGCMLLEALTGRPPFVAENPVQIVLKHLQEEPRIYASLRRLEVPQQFEKIILHCLKKSPDDRYQHMDEIIMDLEFVRQGKPPLVAEQQEVQEQRKEGARRRNWQLVAVAGLFFVAYLTYISRYDTVDACRRFSTSAYCLVMYCFFGGVPLYMFFRPLRKLWHRLKHQTFTNSGDRWLLLLLLTFCLDGLVAIFLGLAVCTRINEFDVFVTGQEIPNTWLTLTNVPHYAIYSAAALHLVLIVLWLWRSRKILKQGEISSGW